jgi:hypothetical protein
VRPPAYEPSGPDHVWPLDFQWRAAAQGDDAVKRGDGLYIRCDNGPELTANALRDWCHFSGAGSAYIDPGSPWLNPWVESFGSRVRDELLGVELFSCLAEAKVMVENWREDYNERRPHSALALMAPAKLARRWHEDRRGVDEDAHVVSLQSPYGLLARDDDTALRPGNDDQLSQQVDR